MAHLRPVLIVLCPPYCPLSVAGIGFEWIISPEKPMPHHATPTSLHKCLHPVPSLVCCPVYNQQSYLGGQHHVQEGPTAHVPLVSASSHSSVAQRCSARLPV